MKTSTQLKYSYAAEVTWDMATEALRKLALVL